MKEKSKRNFGLDLMRVIAIGFVLMFHWLGISGHYRDSFSVFGFYGVEFFFVLSGFLIGNILIKAYLHERSFNFKVILNFWSRRWLRTLPLYYFILLAEIVVFSFKKIAIIDLWKYVFFLQNIVQYNPNSHDFYGVSWSLSIEEWFYLLFPVLLLVVNYLLKRFLSKGYILFTVVMIFIIVSLLIRFGFSQGHFFEWNDQFRKAVVCREDSIAFGVLGALIHNINKEILVKWRYRMAAIGFGLLIYGGYIFIKDIALEYAKVSGNVSVFSKTILFSMISFAVFLVLPFFYYLKVRSLLIGRVVSFISKISYSLYLVHLFVLEPLGALIKPGRNIFYISLSFFLFFSLSILISSFTYKYIEETFLKIRDRVFNEKYNAV